MHYSSMVVDLFREEHQLSKRPVPSIALEGAKDSDAAELKSRFASELLIWQNVCTRQLANKSFSAARPLVSEPHLDLGRMKKAARFVRVLRSAFRSAFRTVRLLNSVKTYNELPETYVEFMNFLPTLIAYVLDNTLDNPSRLRKISVIVSKLPVSFIIMSLRFVNPAPLIERMLRLFLWSPSKGIYSLVQKLASHLCALESTNTRYKRYKARASSRRCIEIETIATKDGTIASLDTETQLRAFFRVRGIDDLSAAELKFAIICIRKREKEAFINALAEPATINFIIHMARLFPELLDDIAKYGDLANIVGQFFDSLRRSIHSLERYSKYRAKSSHSSSRQSHASSRHSYASSRNSLSANESDVRPSAGEDDLYDEALDALSQEIVQDIQDAWYDFLQSLFPALQKVASAAIAGKKSILVSMVDWFMRGITRFVDLNDAGSLFGDLEDDETPSEEPAGSEAERSTMAPPPSHTGTLGSARTRMSRKQSIESFFGFENFPILDHALAHLTHDELSTLWDESEKLIDVALQGLDQRLWPEMPILNGKAVDAFRFEIIKLLSQSDKLLA
nr:hypothetical protein HK105_000971 [Polyrhizophydium stewartii]